MKKFLASVLSLSMIMSLALVSMAALPDWDSDTYGHDPDYFRYDDKAYSYEDFIGYKNGPSHLIPGNEYYYELTWEGKPLIEEFFQHYTMGAYVGTAFPGYTKAERDAEDAYLSSAAAEKLVSADFVKLDGKYYLHLDVSKSFPYTKEKTLWVYAIAKDKLDDSYRSRITLELDIGYEKGGVVTVNDNEATVDNSEPIMEFTEDVGNCTIEFEDGSFFEAKFSTKKDTKVNLHHSTEGNVAVQMANSKADMTFLNFTAHPSFMYKGRLLLKAPGNMKYAYVINDDGSLTQVGAKPYEGYISVLTDKLQSYVVSDIPLNSPKGVVPVKPAEPSNPAVPQVPSENLPFNPGTGASI